MKLKNYYLALGTLACLGALSNCKDEITEVTEVINNDTTIVMNNDTTIIYSNVDELTPLESSHTPASILKVWEDFSDIELSVVLSSEDTLPSSPSFVYGSMADGAGLIAENDGTFTLINNIEADYSIARILLNSDLKPVIGEYILNSTATGGTAQCSGNLVMPATHGFGPLYLSGGEWDGNSQGVFATDPYKRTSDASAAWILTALGQWNTENAVVLGKDAYADKTVVLIGDDESNNSVPSGQLGMYVGNRGDLAGGKLYGLKVTDSEVEYEMDMEEGQEYNIEFVELEQKGLDLLDTEAKNKGVMGFSRLEDIDWRKGSAANEREVYFAVTGRDKPDLIGKGSRTGRVYKLVLNDTDPTAAGTITCVLDGDKGITDPNAVAAAFHSPDNILTTENYVYIQEDPNGIQGIKEAANHYPYLYQYNINTGELKVVLECDQVTAASLGYGNTSSIWELTGMIDITDEVNNGENTFLIMTQNHGWERANGLPFTDPTAVQNLNGSRKEGSVLFKIVGLER
ncbi:PhoX family protein [Fulvivirga maritima]|uniref:PhoX family protein n=1 Tax=Fulvivirga maritima TaxID=2904247 RepID=UPI001F3154A1|nr:PhoX family protein [Fulvivirga maritima]UII26620.1 PhoX family protein [Fulvivirga maritima]